MKKLIAFIIITFAFIACKKNNSSYTPDCSGAAKSYVTDVTPVISGKCTGCHSEYSNLAGVTADKSRIRTSIVSGSMPRNKTMTDAEKNSVVCWIDAGAPNN